MILALILKFILVTISFYTLMSSEMVWNQLFLSLPRLSWGRAYPWPTSFQASWLRRFSSLFDSGKVCRWSQLILRGLLQHLDLRFLWRQWCHGIENRSRLSYLGHLDFPALRPPYLLRDGWLNQISFSCCRYCCRAAGILSCRPPTYHSQALYFFHATAVSPFATTLPAVVPLFRVLWSVHLIQPSSGLDRQSLGQNWLDSSRNCWFCDDVR